MYADGSIVPIASYKGVRFSTQQINDYVAGKAIRVDGCQGAMPAVWIKFNQQRMTPGVYSSNPDLAGQAASQSQNYSTRLSQVPSSGASQTQEGCANGGALPDDFKLWLSRHPGFTIEEALLVRVFAVTELLAVFKCHTECRTFFTIEVVEDSRIVV